MTATSRTAPVSWAPGPRGLPLLGSLVAFARDPLGFLTGLRDRADFVTWSLGPRRSIFVSRPEHIAELLAASGRTFEQFDVGWAFQRVVGESVIMSHGEDWRRKRSLVQPVVRPRQVRGYSDIMVDCAEGLADTWRPGERIDVLRQMTRVTQQIVVRALFSGDLEEQGSALTGAMTAVQRGIEEEVRGGIGLFLPGWVSTPSRRRLRAALDTIDGEFHRLITARRAAGEGAYGDDLLGRLLAARDEQGRPLSDREVRDEAVTLWIGGHETTATTLTWIWVLLSAAPRARARLDEELARVLGGRTPTHADYERLTWTQQVVKEALRIYPPAWVIPVTARGGASLAGTPVAPGTMVWCSQWATHRDPRWFPEPLEFRPERWDQDAPDVVPEHAWFPFGGGLRACLGARFALVQATLVLATLAQRFRVEVETREVAPKTTMLLQPSVPVLATLRAVAVPERAGGVDGG
jgi:cytochrome P450